MTLSSLFSLKSENSNNSSEIRPKTYFKIKLYKSGIICYYKQALKNKALAGHPERENNPEWIVNSFLKKEKILKNTVDNPPVTCYYIIRPQREEIS